MSYKAEFCVQGEWCANELRFQTEKACKLYARDLFMRWTMPSDNRVTECDDAPTLGSSTVQKYESEVANKKTG